MLSKGVKHLLISGAMLLKENEDRLSEIDGVLGDGDHGVTIGKIAHVIEENASADAAGESLKGFLEDLSWKIMNVNGGSAGPLWGTLFEGMAAAVPADTDEITEDLLKQMLQGSLQALQEVSGAKVGDKTMMDALIPAVEAAVSAQGGISSVLEAAAAAAEKGAADTVNYVARFGRAKNSKDRCIGQLDPGAVSMALWFRGMSAGLAAGE